MSLAMKFLGWLVQGVLLSSLLLLHPVGWVVVALGLGCGVAALRHQYRPEWRWCLAAWPLVTSSVAIGLGMAFPAGEEGVSHPAASQALDVLMVAHFAGCGLAVVLGRGFRLLLVPVLCAGTFVFLGCGVMSAMAVTGDGW